MCSLARLEQERHAATSGAIRGRDQKHSTTSHANPLHRTETTNDCLAAQTNGDVEDVSCLEEASIILIC
jgi:hypothetical protein